MKVMNTSFLSEAELQAVGLAGYGTHVLISRNASLYQPEKITIGNHVRIDDFCILSGNITIGNHVHISAYTALYGQYGIEIGNYCGISPRCTLFSATDDFSGEHLIGPMAPLGSTCVTGGKIVMEAYSQLGAGCIVLPDLIIGEGSITGAMTLILKSLNAWGIYAGIPAKRMKERKRELLHLNK
jgi:acetyltransferase-like isoleucine patch superfamily enzyme